MAIAKKTERVHLVAKPQEAAAWRLAADSQGVSLSELIRRAAEVYVHRLAAGQNGERTAA